MKRGYVDYVLSDSPLREFVSDGYYNYFVDNLDSNLSMEDLIKKFNRYVIDVYGLNILKCSSSLDDNIKQLDLFCKLLNLASIKLSKDFCINCLADFDELNDIVSFVVINGNNTLLSKSSKMFVDCYSNDVSNNSDYIDVTTAYFRDVKPMLTSSEENQLYLKISNGDKGARKELVERNLRLVIKIANKYKGRGVEFMDLIQEGNFGLMRAASDFDPRKNNKFSTYATNWIKSFITRAICDKSRTIRISAHAFYTISNYKLICSNYEFNYNRMPTLEELSNELKMSQKDVINLQSYISDAISYNVFVGEDNDIEMIDLIEDSSIDVEREVLDRELDSDIDYAFIKAHLSEREVDIIRKRFGFENKCYTLDEIGNMYTLTRERVRQIEAKAIAKLRRHSSKFLIERGHGKKN